MIDIRTPLSPIEAGRVKTVYEQEGIRIKYRILTGFSPETIARNLKLKAAEVAQAAGRDQTTSPPIKE